MESPPRGGKGCHGNPDCAHGPGARRGAPGLVAGAAGRPVGKGELLQAVWPSVVVTEESLTRCISDIRQALGDEGQRVIRTLPRRGYVFVSPLMDEPPLPGGPSPSERSRISSARAYP